MDITEPAKEILQKMSQDTYGCVSKFPGFDGKCSVQIGAEVIYNGSIKDYYIICSYLDELYECGLISIAGNNSYQINAKGTEYVNALNE